MFGPTFPSSTKRHCTIIPSHTSKATLFAFHIVPLVLITISPSIQPISMTKVILIFTIVYISVATEGLYSEAIGLVIKKFTVVYVAIGHTFYPNSAHVPICPFSSIFFTIRPCINSINISPIVVILATINVSTCVILDTISLCHVVHQGSIEDFHQIITMATSTANTNARKHDVFNIIIIIIIMNIITIIRPSTNPNRAHRLNTPTNHPPRHPLPNILITIRPRIHTKPMSFILPIHTTMHITTGKHLFPPACGLAFDEGPNKVIAGG
mmetsp:Transcript_7010/g.10693  ORF Transcript_7010/g.10693 Transcript_7010/m.10693 type:complete len:268 (-) Transcript_7010:268-1071(-)